MKNNKAFTLLELIVVIAIVGLLITISIAFLSDAKQRGTDTGRISAVNQVKNALNIYFNDANGGNGFYPIGTGTTTLTSSLVPKYITSINPNIKYDSATGATYHLGIALLGSDNKVLSSDRDNATGFQGSSVDCGSTLGTDLCYDVTP